MPQETADDYPEMTVIPRAIIFEGDKIRVTCDLTYEGRRISGIEEVIKVDGLTGVTIAELCFRAISRSLLLDGPA